MEPGVQELLRTVRRMAFDVDGVLTDGSLWYAENGEMLKRFNALDGHGLRLLGESGIIVALITGRQGPIISRRAAELGISIVHQGIRDKSETLEALAREHGRSEEHTSELQSLMRISYAVFCLKKKTKHKAHINN